MYKNSNFRRSLSAAFGAVVVSFAVVGTAVGTGATQLSASVQASVA